MSGRSDVLRINQGLAELAERQAMAVSREQLLHLGVHPRHVDGHFQAGRWREPVPGVVVLHRGPPPPPTTRWITLLAAGPDAALCSWTALALHGLAGWERPSVHVVVPRGRHVPAMLWATIHESRRHTAADRQQLNGIPVHGVERAAIDAAAWTRSARTATGLLAAVVQQGLTRPERLAATLEAAGRVRHRKRMLLALADIEGGAQALSEIDLARLCRAAGLPEPVRQRVRRDANGRRRYLDVEWRLPDGRVVALEVDGVGHMEAGRWYDDLLRQAELVIDEPHVVIRLPASAVRLEPQRVIAILARALAVRPVSTW
ncbi:MAG: hypothetical protein M3P23_11995 [Actinomycetota bacterium]|nr:hypothetical protein [Actinomycetota bacterium]